MAGASHSAALAGRLGKARGFALKLAPLFDIFGRAFERETALRRPFLWLPVAAGAGAVLYLSADREPSLGFTGLAAILSGFLAYIARAKRPAFFFLCGLCALFAGELSAALRAARVAAPVLDRIRIAALEGYIEEMDYRREGARLLLRVRSAEGLAPEHIPSLARLSLRRTPPFEAGTYVRLKARLLPPARASLPGGYDFARDAWFAGIGAVGNVLGRIEVIPAPAPPGLWASAMMAVDRGRNALARRIDKIVGGDAGAIAAAMVTGKRGLLSSEAKEIIREAGIFHIITISGVQMTLVAGIFFVGLRRLLALSQTLALAYPVKKWSALFAIAGALFYDIATGSRVGTERALFMTLIMLSAVLLDRQALTMRNLALAAALVVALEPEAIMGASFQLSFAAVAALVAVYEARMAAVEKGRAEALRSGLFSAARGRSPFEAVTPFLRRGPLGLLFATFCATAATASFMAYNFHELSPYVLIGNPLTLAAIELFAVPGALAGAALYPLGLDAWVWRLTGLGIDGVLMAARVIGSWPCSTIHLPAFAPWSIVFLSLAVLSSVLWRTAVLRATAIPLAAIGLLGAMSGPPFDLAVSPAGDAVAFRAAGGRLAVIGRGGNAFAAEQWLRADADGRPAAEAVTREGCDQLGCVGHLASGKTVALVFEPAAFAEDCFRADIIVTPRYAPLGCAASLVIDREKLNETGALTLAFAPDGSIKIRAARAPDEDRPWSPAPKRRWGKSPVPPQKDKKDEDSWASWDAPGDSGGEPLDSE
jgi:competence protein ComEC